MDGFFDVKTPVRIYTIFGYWRKRYSPLHICLRIRRKGFAEMMYENALSIFFFSSSRVVHPFDNIAEMKSIF